MRNIFIIIIFLFSSLFSQEVTKQGKIKAKAIRNGHIQDATISITKMSSSAMDSLRAIAGDSSRIAAGDSASTLRSILRDTTLQVLSDSAYAKTIALKDSAAVVTADSLATLYAADTATVNALDVDYGRKVFYSGSEIGQGTLVRVSGGYAPDGFSVIVSDNGGYWVRQERLNDKKTINVLWGSGITNDSTDISTELATLWGKLPDSANVIFPSGIYYISGANSYLNKAVNSITFDPGCEIYGERTANTLLYIRASTAGSAGIGEVFPDFEYDDFEQVAGDEVVAGQYFIRVTDTTDWIATGLKRGDLIHISSSITKSGYNLSASFIFDGYGTESGSEVIYSLVPLRHTFPIDDNDDLLDYATVEGIVIFPLTSGFVVNGGVFHDIGVRAFNVRDAVFSNMVFSTSEGYESYGDRGLEVSRSANLNISNYVAKGFLKSGLGYGLGLSDYHGVVVSNTLFQYNRHCITTGTGYYGYSEDLIVDNSLVFYGDEYSNLYTAFDTHGNVYDTKLSNIRTYGAAYIFNGRGQGSEVINSKSYYGGGIGNYIPVGPDTARYDHIIKDCQMIEPDGAYYVQVNENGSNINLKIEKGKIKNHTPTAITAIVHNRGAMVDTLKIDGFEYDKISTTSISNLISYTNNDTNNGQFVHLNNITAKNFDNVLFGGISGAGSEGQILELKITNSNLSYFNEIVDLLYGDGAGGYAADTTLAKKIINKVIIEDNTLTSFGNVLGTAGRYRIDTLYFDNNKVHQMYYGLGGLAGQATEYHRWKSNEFYNSFLASRRLFDQNTSSSSSYLGAGYDINQLEFIDNIVHKVDSAQVRADTTLRNEYGFTVPTLYIPTALGFFQDHTTEFNVKIEGNEFLQAVDTTHNTNGVFLQLTGANVEFNNNKIIPSNGIFGDVSTTYGIKLYTCTGSFRDNYIEATGASRSASYLLVSSNAVSIDLVGNTFNSLTTISGGFPYTVTGTGTFRVGNNFYSGFAGPPTFGGSINETPFVMDRLWMYDATDGVYREVVVDNDSLRTD